MTLVRDRRSELQGAAGTHALIVGVSAYPHLLKGTGEPASEQFGMGQLSSTATTAAILAEALLSIPLAQPLATCRLLVSPSETEAHDLFLQAGVATRDAFLKDAADWRSDAAADPDGIALLYLAGLGMDRGYADQLFLLQDFGDPNGPLFRNVVPLSSMVHQMAPDERQPRIARRQVFIFDAGRNRVPVAYTPLLESAGLPLLESAGLADVLSPMPDDRMLLTLSAAQPGGRAYATERATIFSDLLLYCLRGGAAELLKDGRWGVTMNSLIRGLQEEARALGEHIGRRITVGVGGAAGDALLVALPKPPNVMVTIEIEGAAWPNASLQLRDTRDEVVWSVARAGGKPHVATVPAGGVYRLTVEPEPGSGRHPVRQPLRFVEPLNRYWRVAVSDA